jgi:Tn3 transposase DDE domain
VTRAASSTRASHATAWHGPSSFIVSGKFATTCENQQYRACGLNLLVTAITLWNTRYLNRAIAALREIEDVSDQLLARLSPLGWEHINSISRATMSGHVETKRRKTMTDFGHSGRHPTQHCWPRRFPLCPLMY